MTEHEAANAYLPFLVSEKDLARALNVSKAHVQRLFVAGALDVMQPIQVSDRIIRFRKPGVESYFGASLAEVMPWLIAQKEPA